MMYELRQVLKSTVALGAARLVEKGSGVCVSFLVARHLGAAALGVYTAAIVLFGLVSLLGGCATFVVREVSKDRTRSSSYLIHIGGMVLVFSFCIMMLSLVIVPRLGCSVELGLSIYAITVASIPGVLKPIQEAVFVAHQKTEFLTYVSFIAAPMNVGGTIYLLHQGHAVVSLVLMFVLLQYIVGGVLLFLLNQYVSPLRWDLSFGLCVRLIKEIKAFVGSSILAAFFARPEVIILSVIKNDAQVGFYGAALRIVDLWLLIPETLMANVVPFMSRAQGVAGRRQAQLIVDKSLKYLLAVSLPLMAGILVTARPIVELVYGPGFESSVRALRILALYIPFAFMHEVLWRLLAARDQQHLMLRAQVITTSVRLAGGYGLIVWLGSLGGALTTTLIMLEHNLLLALYIRRDGTRLGLFRLGWRFSIAALSMALLTAVFVDRWKLWTLVPWAAACYAGMVFLLKAVSRDDIAPFRRPDRRADAEVIEPTCI